MRLSSSERDYLRSTFVKEIAKMDAILMKDSVAWIVDVR